MVSDGLANQFQITIDCIAIQSSQSRSVNSGESRGGRVGEQNDNARTVTIANLTLSFSTTLSRTLFKFKNRRLVAPEYVDLVPPLDDQP